MVAFTFFFVRELPEASPDTTLIGQPSTTTVPDATATTVEGGTELDPETQAYLDELNEINDGLQILNTEMITVNDGFDADPREVEYRDAVSRLEAVETTSQTLSDQLDAMTVPAGLEVNHDVLKTTIRLAVGSAGDALDGLQSTDTGELRRAAAESFTQAAEDFDTEVGNAHNAASAS